MGCGILFASIYCNLFVDCRNMTAETTYEAILIQLAVIWISNSDRKQIQFAPSSRAGPTQKGDPLMFICPMTNFAISVTFFHLLRLDATPKRTSNLCLIHITSLIHKWNHYFSVVRWRKILQITERRGKKHKRRDINCGTCGRFADCLIVAVRRDSFQS